MLKDTSVFCFLKKFQEREDASSTWRKTFSIRNSCTSFSTQCMQRSYGYIVYEISGRLLIRHDVSTFAR